MLQQQQEQEEGKLGSGGAAWHTSRHTPPMPFMSDQYPMDFSIQNNNAISQRNW